MHNDWTLVKQAYTKVLSMYSLSFTLFDRGTTLYFCMSALPFG